MIPERQEVLPRWSKDHDIRDQLHDRSPNHHRFAPGSVAGNRDSSHSSSVISRSSEWTYQTGRTTSLRQVGCRYNAKSQQHTNIDRAMAA
jgi:hypothetical protein